jgi:hypothetical protein
MPVGARPTVPAFFVDAVDGAILPHNPNPSSARVAISAATNAFLVTAMNCVGMALLRGCVLGSLPQVLSGL